MRTVCLRVACIAYLLVGVVLQNELFQEEERPLVVHLAETATVTASTGGEREASRACPTHLLTQLNNSLPSIFCRHPVTIFARIILNDILHHKRLLQNGPSEDLREAQS